MIHTEIIVKNWNYHNGWVDIPIGLRSIYNGEEREFREELAGWHCRVYLASNAMYDNFMEWMKTNMKGYFSVDFRFNGGDAFHSVHISNEEDTTLFRLRWS